MKKFFSVSLIVAAAASLGMLSSCHFGCVKGSGRQITETHKVGAFTRLEIDGDFKVNLKQDSSGVVSITADDNLMKYIISESDGDKLVIKSRKNFCESGEMVINIGVKQLERLKGSGAVEFVSDGKLNTKDLDIRLSGASKVDMDLTAANVVTHGSGLIGITLKGQATSHKIDLTGSGKVSALDFVVGSYDISATGASHCDINVLNELEVSTTGSSEIRYRGNPTKVNNSKTGASSVTKID